MIPDHLFPREAEQKLLGSIMRESSNDDVSCFWEASSIVRAEDFYSAAHGILWIACASIAESGQKIEPLSIGNYIDRAQQTEEIGGIRAIIELWDGAPSAPNIAFHAGIVREKADLRRYLRIGEEIVAKALEVGAEPSEIATAADVALVSVRDRGASKSRPIAKSIELAMEEWTRRQNTAPGELCGVPTPWPKLNLLTGGLQAGELSVLAARPSVGKTLFALNLIAHVCDRGGVVQFASLEQQDVELVNRWCACRAGINSMKFRDCRFLIDEEGQLARVTSHISRIWNLETTESGSQNVSSIIADLRRRRRREGRLDLAVIDYLGLIENDSHSKELRIYLGDMCRRLKVAAKDIGCHIMLLCQLNRNKEHRGTDAEPLLSDLRDSGNIEEHADAVFMLHKPDAENEHSDTDRVQVFIRKQRNGRRGIVTCEHAKKYFEIREMANGEPRL